MVPFYNTRNRVILQEDFEKYYDTKKDIEFKKLWMADIANRMEVWFAEMIQNNKQELYQICRSNIYKYYLSEIPKWKQDDKRNEILDRLSEELNYVDCDEMFSLYLAVYFTLRDCHLTETYISTRGAIGNSIIPYLLGITGIDPIQYGLDYHFF